MKLTGDLLNRRSGRIVQGRPLRARALGQHFRVVHTSGIVWGLATVAALAASIRPSVFQAGHIPSWPGSCESSTLPPVAALLSPLLSAAIWTVRVLATYPAEVFRGSEGGKSACRWTSFQSPSMRGRCG